MQGTRLLTAETHFMQTTLLSLYSRLQTLILQEEGQDLIEYALVVALIAFAAVTSMQTLAVDINNTFLAIGSSLTSA